jgi:hypothetical protein
MLMGFPGTNLIDCGYVGGLGKDAPALYNVFSESSIIKKIYKR